MDKSRLLDLLLPLGAGLASAASPALARGVGAATDVMWTREQAAAKKRKEQAELDKQGYLADIVRSYGKKRANKVEPNVPQAMALDATVADDGTGDDPLEHMDPNDRGRLADMAADVLPVVNTPEWDAALADWIGSGGDPNEFLAMYPGKKPGVTPGQFPELRKHLGTGESLQVGMEDGGQAYLHGAPAPENRRLQDMIGPQGAGVYGVDPQTLDAQFVGGVIPPRQPQQRVFKDTFTDPQGQRVTVVRDAYTGEELSRNIEPQQPTGSGTKPEKSPALQASELEKKILELTAAGGDPATIAALKAEKQALLGGGASTGQAPSLAPSHSTEDMAAAAAFLGRPAATPTPAPTPKPKKEEKNARRSGGPRIGKSVA